MGRNPGPAPRPGRIDGGRVVDPRQTAAALALAVLLGVSGGLLVWDSTRSASLTDLLWCRTHPEQVGWAVVAFDIDLGEEGATAEACSLARDVGTERLERLIEEERNRLRGHPVPNGTPA